MAAIGRAGLVIFIVLMAAGVKGQETDPDIDCADPIVSLSPCLMNMMRSSTPVDDCCDALAAVITSHASCLCDLVSSDDFLGFPINQTLALSLPSACSLNYPWDLNQCIIVLPPSTDAPTVQPESNAPAPLFEAEVPSPSDGTPIVDLPPMESFSFPPPSIDDPKETPFPNASGAAALFPLFWGSLLTAILTAAYLR